MADWKDQLGGALSNGLPVPVAAPAAKVDKPFLAQVFEKFIAPKLAPAPVATPATAPIEKAPGMFGDALKAQPVDASKVNLANFGGGFTLTPEQIAAAKTAPAQPAPEPAKPATTTVSITTGGPPQDAQSQTRELYGSQLEAQNYRAGSGGQVMPEHEARVMMASREAQAEAQRDMQIAADQKMVAANLQEAAIQKQIATNRVEDAKIQTANAEINAQKSQEEELMRAKEIEDFSNSIQSPKSLYNTAQAASMNNALWGQLAASMAQIGGNPQAIQQVQNLNQVFDKSFEKEIDKQEKLFKLNLGSQESAYAKAMARYGSPEAARNSLRSANNGLMAAQYEQLAAQSKVPAIQAQAADLSAKRAQQKLEWDLKIHPYVATQVRGGREATVFVPKLGFEVPVSQFKKMKIDEFKMLEGKQMDAQGKVLEESVKGGTEGNKTLAQRTINLGQGEKIIANSTKEAEELLKQRNSAARVMTQIDRTVERLKKLGITDRLRNLSPITTNSKEWNEAESSMGSVVIAAKNAAELGAISGSDAKLIEDMIGGLRTQPTAGAVEKLETYKSDVKAAIDTQLRAHEGFVPAPPKGAKPGWENE